MLILDRKKANFLKATKSFSGWWLTIKPRYRGRSAVLKSLIWLPASPGVLQFKKKLYYMVMAMPSFHIISFQICKGLITENQETGIVSAGLLMPLALCVANSSVPCCVGEARLNFTCRYMNLTLEVSSLRRIRKGPNCSL